MRVREPTAVRRTRLPASRLLKYLATPLFALLLSLTALPALAAIESMPFDSPEQEQRFRALAAELRCVMCQNQSLADSNAGIAGDLRREILDLMKQGRSDEEIKAFLSERYTDFVLYNPPLRSNTLLLWFGPLAVLLAGGIGLFVTLRRRARQYRSQGAQTPPPEGDEW